VASRAVAPRAAYGREDERELTFAGFVAFIDPPLEGAAAAVAALATDGVQVKILTGDSELVTQKICADLGLVTGEMLTSVDVDRMSDPALSAVAERTTVFARVSPVQKNRIVQALRSRGHVVGYMGDGITMRQPCAPPTSGFPSRTRWTSRGTPPTSSCSRRASPSCTTAWWRGAGASATS
jgi:Mg2+-importing ATPase